jgi:hypothetical protein
MVALGKFDQQYAEMLRVASQSAGLPFPELPKMEILEDWRAQCALLTDEWKRLPEGDCLILDF